MLPNALHVADPFHMIRLANQRLDRQFIQAATELEALYRTGTAPNPPAGRRCNADMPRAHAATGREPGHPAATMPSERVPYRSRSPAYSSGTSIRSVTVKKLSVAFANTSSSSKARNSRPSITTVPSTMVVSTAALSAL